MGLTNTLNGVNLTAIAQETANTLLPYLSGLKQIAALDLSNDISEQGSGVMTRVVAAYTAQDLSSGYTAAVSNTSTVSIMVTLDTFEGTVLGFTDLEMSKSSIDLQRMVYSPMANSAAYSIYSSLFQLVSNATYTQKQTIAAASFDSDGLIDTSTLLNKAYVPPSP